MIPPAAALYRALTAETLKLKRTLALGLAFLAPLAIGFLLVVMFVQMGPSENQPDSWKPLIQNGHVLWSLLMLPLFVTLQMGLLANIEHGNKAWKLLYAQPLPRWTVYAAKQLISLVLIALSMFVLVGVLYISGRLVQLITPAFRFDQPFPWARVALATGAAFLASWLIVAFHLWFSIRIPSFVASMAVGIVGTVAAVLVIQSEKYAPYYPWTLAGMSAMNALQGKEFMNSLVIGVAGGVIIALSGCWDASRREVL
jgi:lantibiotic transport system permease protein